MHQRLGLAAALLGDPPVLLLDEPANGLDPEGMAWLRGLLRDRADAGGTILISSHVLAEVAQIADHAVIIHSGQLRFAGPLSTLTDNGTSLEDAFLDLTRTAARWRRTQCLVITGVSSLAVGGADLDTAAGIRELFSHAGVASAILSLVLGLTAVAGEYRHRSITDTYLATPTRTPVITAKLAAYATLGALLGIVSAATGLLTTAIWTTAKNGTLDLAQAGAWRITIGIIALNAAYAAIGVSLGALIRNLTAAIAIALIWLVLVETTVATLLGDLGRGLPNRAGMALDYMPTPALLPQWGAALTLTAYTTLFALTALTTTIRRDVT
jgi:ABC-2 type transport system permease protein